MNVHTESGGNLAKVPTLTSVSNYFAWMRVISPLLLGFRALSIVEGKDTCPTIGPTSNNIQQKAYEAWKDRDAKAMSYIDQTVSPALYAMIKNLSTSAEKWDRLAKLNNLKTSDHRATINKKVANLYLDESGDMAAHLTAFVELVAEAEAAGLTWGTDDKEKAHHFLDTLPHSLRVIKTEWRAQPESERDFFSLIQLYNEEDAARQRSADRTSEATAMAAFQKHKGNKNFRKSGSESRNGNKDFNNNSQGHKRKSNNTSGSKTDKCYGCGKPGHTRTECHKTKHLPHDAIICWHCFKPGHTLQECRTRNTQHAKTVTTKNEDILAPLLDEHAMFAHKSDPKTVAFMVDSGASQHIVAHDWMLTNVRDTASIAFQTVGSRLTSTKTGDIKGTLINGRGVTFKDACYLPEGGVNLLSEELLRERGFTKVVNDNGDAFLQHKTKSDWRMKLHKQGRARYLIVNVKSGSDASFDSKANEQMLASAKSVTPGSLMDHHVKLGHVSASTLKKLVKAGMIDVTDKDSLKLSKLWCETCIAAKSARAPFTDTPQRATKPLEIVVSDVSGPFKPAFGGFKYFVTFIDEYTDLTSAVLIKSKDEVFSKLQAWVKAAELAFDHKVQVLRTDGGGEYVNKTTTAWMESKGIAHHTTTPHTPQLNGKAERTNRTLKEMTAAMLIGSGMETRWWGHALMFATSILSRITKTPDGRSLWEVVHKRRSDLTKAHAFGEECWVHIPAPDRSKSDLAKPKAWKGQLVSWPTERSGWGVYNPTSDKIIYSRDVTFTPPCEQPSASDSFDLEANEPTDIAEPQKSFDLETNELQLDDFVDLDDSDEELVADNDEPRHRIPAAAQQREQPVPQEREGDRPVRQLPVRVRRGQPSAYMRDNYATFLQKHEGHLFPINTATTDPVTYDEALSRPNPERQEWIDAINKEFASLIKNGTLEEVIAPEGANIVTTKHVLKTKYDANGNFVKRKARCVARGFTQEYGVDYDDTYAPVARMNSLRIFLVIVIVYKLKSWQGDVETAFLHPDMDRPLYIEFPEGWIKINPKATGLLVKKGLYGFKQSARLWWLHLMETLIKMGFEHSEYDWGIFIRFEEDESFTIVFVYVDDMLVASSTQTAVDSVRSGLKQAYSITDLGQINSVLGISVQLTKDTVRLSQAAYIDTVLDRFGLTDCKTEPTPIATGTKLIKDGTPLDGGKDGLRKYQALIGGLLWIALSTRPDISYAVSTLARFTSSPTKDHWRVGMRVLRYLKGTKHLALTFKPDKTLPPLSGYSDADWAGDAGARQSQSGYVFTLHGCTISWASLRQDCVSLSSTESEYVALTEAAKESVWLKRAMTDYSKAYQDPVLIRGDNQGSLALASNPGFHRRTKHIELRYHYIRKLKEAGEIDLQYVDTHQQVADTLTKAVPEAILVKHRTSMGLISEST